MSDGGDAGTRQLLAVVGMHRSGTSLVAAQLRTLGWGVGPEDELMPPKPDNPLGFVEHMPVVRLNGRLLDRLGGRWDDPPPLPAGWEHAGDLDDLRDEAAAIAAALTATAPRVLVKDPRLSLTLPFWRTVCDPAVLHVLRPPGPVARSLSEREDHLDPDAGADLWTRYVTSALATAPDAVLLSTAALFADPTAVLRRTATALGHEPTDEQLAAATASIEPRLWGRTGGARGDDDQSSPALRTAAVLHDALVGPDGDDWQQALGRLVRLEPSAVPALQARLDDVRLRLEQQRSQVAELRRDREAARAWARRRDEAAASAQQALEHAVAARDEHRTLLEEARGRIESLEAEIERRRAPAWRRVLRRS